MLDTSEAEDVIFVNVCSKVLLRWRMTDATSGLSSIEFIIVSLHEETDMYKKL